MNREPVRWEDRAACKGQKRFTEWDERTQKQFCQGCPVTAECLSYANDKDDTPTDEPGWPVYGGLTGKERRLIRDRQARAARSTAT